jgi:hypothetical protein
MKIRV